MAEAFLGADGDDDFLVGVELNAPAVLVPLGGFASQVIDAGGHAITVVSGVLSGLAQLVDDPGLGRIGGVSHAEVDDVGAGALHLVLEFVDASEQVGREAQDAVGNGNLVGFSHFTGELKVRGAGLLVAHCVGAVGSSWVG